MKNYNNVFRSEGVTMFKEMLAMRRLELAMRVDDIDGFTPVEMYQNSPIAL